MSAANRPHAGSCGGFAGAAPGALGAPAPPPEGSSPELPPDELPALPAEELPALPADGSPPEELPPEELPPEELKTEGTGVEPLLPKNSPAHAFLNTPLEGGAPTADGRNTFARSFQVIMGTIASTRLSYAASSKANAPPYEPPTAATRGSSG